MILKYIFTMLHFLRQTRQQNVAHFVRNFVGFCNGLQQLFFIQQIYTQIYSLHIYPAASSAPRTCCHNNARQNWQLGNGKWQREAATKFHCSETFWMMPGVGCRYGCGCGCGCGCINASLKPKGRTSGCLCCLCVSVVACLSQH